MKLLYRKAYRSFYFRPKVIANLLWHTRSKAQARTIYNGIKRLIQRPITKLDIRISSDDNAIEMATAEGQKS